MRSSLLDAGRGERTRAVLAEVAEHHLDPYAAADRLLAELGRT
jgi:hypothetical protein